jgi:hypothetical protein
MAKFALLIGVSHYASGISPLPEAERDVQAMQELLEQKDFDEVQALVDPQGKDLIASIEELLANRRDDDVVLLYFSGHGFRDSNNDEFYLPTRTIGKSSINQMISASFIKEAFNSSRATNQIVVLDCCHSGAASQEFSSPKDLASQLISKNRAILASLTPLATFSDRQANLSVFTRYFVEGLQTGLADADCDGSISVNDVYQYVKNKLQNIGLRQFAELFASEKTREISITRSSDSCQNFIMNLTGSLTSVALFEESESLATDYFNQDTEVPLLLMHLRSKNSHIRQKAAEILGNIRAEIAVPQLCYLLSEDEDADVRSSAADALGKIYERTGVD